MSREASLRFDSLIMRAVTEHISCRSGMLLLLFLLLLPHKLLSMIYRLRIIVVEFLTLNCQWLVTTDGTLYSLSITLHSTSGFRSSGASLASLCVRDDVCCVVTECGLYSCYWYSTGGRSRVKQT